MLAKGNGEPLQCVANLLRITRGECIYDRIKGINPEYIDKPSVEAKPLLMADIKWLMITYEPRVNLDKTAIEALASQAGAFLLETNASKEV